MRIYFTEAVRILCPLLILAFTAMGYAAEYSRNRKAADLLILIRYLIKDIYILLCFLSEAVWLKNGRILLFGLFVTCLSCLYDALLDRIPDYRTDNVILQDAVILFLTGTAVLTRLNFSHAVRQFIIGAVGFAAAGLVLLFKEQIFAFALRMRFESWKKYIAPAAGAAGFIILLSVLLFGSPVNGSILGISIFGLTFQPSEPVKALYILFLSLSLPAALPPLLKRNRYSGDIRNAGSSRNAGNTAGKSPYRRFVPVLILALAHIGVLVLSRDLGSAGIYFVALIAILFIAEGWKWVPFAGMAAGGAGFAVSYFLFPHVQTRVQAFLDPWSVIDSKGYQVTQSVFAISFGGAFGTGLTRGTPKSIPFVETDFIFAAVCEELGMITGICTVFLCLHIFMRFMRHAQRAHNQFPRLFLSGTAVLFIIQAFLNMGGACRFIPSTGVTLPFVSYGGSSLWSMLILFTMALWIAGQAVQQAAAQTVPGRARRRVQKPENKPENKPEYKPERTAEYEPESVQEGEPEDRYEFYWTE